MLPVGRHLLLLTAALALAAAACGSDPCDASPSGPPSIEILGANDEAGSTFVDVVDGDVRPLIHGMQSGFHLWMNVRLHGLCPYRATLSRSITDVASGQLLAVQGETATFPPTPGDPTSNELPEAFAFFLCPNPAGYMVRDRLVRVDMTVTDRRGRTASASVNVVPTCMRVTQGGVYYDACMCNCDAAMDASCPVPMVDAGK